MVILLLSAYILDESVSGVRKKGGRNRNANRIQKGLILKTRFEREKRRILRSSDDEDSCLMFVDVVTRTDPPHFMSRLTFLIQVSSVSFYSPTIPFNGKRWSSHLLSCPRRNLTN